MEEGGWRNGPERAFSSNICLTGQVTSFQHPTLLLVASPATIQAEMWRGEVSIYFILSVAIITGATPAPRGLASEPLLAVFCKYPPKPEGGLQTQAPGTMGAFK